MVNLMLQSQFWEFNAVATNLLESPEEMVSHGAEKGTVTTDGSRLTQASWDTTWDMLISSVRKFSAKITITKIIHPGVHLSLPMQLCTALFPWKSLLTIRNILCPQPPLRTCGTLTSHPRGHGRRLHIDCMSRSMTILEAPTSVE